MKNRFPLDQPPKQADRLDRLVIFLIIAFAILVAKDCYVQTHRPVCQCKGSAAGQSEGLYEETVDSDGGP